MDLVVGAGPLVLGVREGTRDQEANRRTVKHAKVSSEELKAFSCNSRWFDELKALFP